MTDQLRQLVKIQFKAHATFIMMRLILRVFHGMTHKLACDMRRFG